MSETTRERGAGDAKPSDARARCLIEAPEVATPNEVSALAQEVINLRTVHGLNAHTIREQQVRITELEAKLERVGPLKVRDLARDHLQTSATAHEVERRHVRVLRRRSGALDQHDRIGKRLTS